MLYLLALNHFIIIIFRSKSVLLARECMEKLGLLGRVDSQVTMPAQLFLKKRNQLAHWTMSVYNLTANRGRNTSIRTRRKRRAGLNVYLMIKM